MYSSVAISVPLFERTKGLIVHHIHVMYITYLAQNREKSKSRLILLDIRFYIKEVLAWQQLMSQSSQKMQCNIKKMNRNADEMDGLKS